MKAAVLYELNQPLKMEDQLEIPALQQGQVLVQLAYSGVCHSQLMEARGGRGEDRWLPHLLGHEGSGIVVDTGPGVTKVHKDDAVVLGWIKGSGLDAGGVQYRLGERVINAGAVTTFNEYAVVSENRLVRLPPDLPMDIAVLLGCALPTGAGILTKTLRPRPGSKVAVFGLGGVGLSALMACGLFEDLTVFAVDINPHKLTVAKELGAHVTIDANEVDPVSFLLEQTGGGVDYAIEAAGLTQTIEAAFASVRKGGGRCVFASHPPSDQKISLDPHHLISGKHIEGTWGGDCQPDEDIPFFAEAYRKGRLPLRKLLDKTYTLDEVNLALDDLTQRKVTRPLLKINEP